MRKLCLLPALLAVACTDVANVPDPSTHVAPGTLSWYLPKMTVDVDVSYVLTKCPTGADELPGVQIADVAINPQPVADLTSRRSIVVANLAGWTTSNEVDVSLYPDGTLKSIGAKPQDQTAAIVGNVFKSAVQIAELAVGAPFAAARVPAAVHPTYGCTAAVAKQLNDLQALRIKALDPTLKAADATDNAAAIGRLQAALTFKKSILIDGSGPPPWDAQSTAPRSIAMTVADMRRGAHWLDPTGSPDDARLARGTVLLRWTPSQAVPADPPAPDADYQYRDPLVATLTLLPESDFTHVLARRDIAFAQWGTPRKLPLTAPIFATLDRSYTFAEDGTPTDMKVVTTARGLAASNLLNSATSSAGSAMQQAQSAAAANSELAQVQNQDKLIQAKTALINDTNALKAAGGSP